MARSVWYIGLIACLSLFRGLCISAQSLGQEPSAAYTRLKLEEAVEHALEDKLLTDEEAEAAYAQIEQWLTHPRDANRIQSEELAEYRLLSPYQIYQFILFRTNAPHGITSLYDLKTITGWNEDLAIIIAPLLSMSQTREETWLHALERGKTAGAILFGTPTRPSSQAYLGPAYSTGIRAEFRARDRLSVFLGAERDSYEPWRYAGHRGFDSYTAHIAIHELGPLRSLILGDYRASWGEGLALSQGFRLRPPYAVPRRASGIRPVSSLAESEHSRGIATTLELGRWRATALYSKQQLDGNVKDGYIYGLSETGLHRSEHELQRKHQVPLNHWGGRLSWSNDRLTIGLGLLSMSFAPYRLRHSPGASGIERLYNLQSQSYTTLDYQWVSKAGHLRLSGELARSSLGAYAWVQQFSRTGGRWADWAISARYISPAYWAYYGRTSTHSLRPNNERDISLHISTRELLPSFGLTAGLDLYQRLSSRHTGLAFRSTAEYRRWPTSTLRYTLTYRSQEHTPSSLRMSLQQRWQTARYLLAPYAALSKTLGAWSWAIALQGQLTPKERLKLWINLAIYRASWAGRLYVPEPRIRYQYGFPMLYGKGFRLSAGGQCQVTQRWAIGLRAVYSPKSSGTSANHIALGFYFK